MYFTSILTYTEQNIKEKRETQYSKSTSKNKKATK